MNLANNLKKLRKDNNLSQEELADKLGVSRQSVSKWESGQAYPEMDKVIQLCKLFNLNINDLLNEDINEIKEKKESNNKLNKYVDDFLNFITRTVKLFGALKFKDKIKLIIEELFYILAGFVTYIILGNILAEIFSFIYNIGGYNQFIFSLLKAIYSIIFIVLFLIIFIHIFKIRYLDYYKVIDKSSLEEEQAKEEKEIINENNNIKVEKTNDTKIIIRDEKSSSYSFLNALAKVIVFFIKFIMFFILIGFIAIFIGLVTCIVFSFLVYKNTLLFFGLFNGFLGSLIITGIFIYMIYYFIVNKKIKYKVSGIILLISFILCGLGLGLSIISIKDLKIYGLEGDLVEKKEYTIPMKDDLLIEEDYTLMKEYVEEKRKDIFIETFIVDTKPIEVEVAGNSIIFNQRLINRYGSVNDEFEVIKEILNDINNKKIYKYSENRIIIHASKENLKKLEENEIKARKQREKEYLEEERQIHEEINEFQDE